MEHPYIQIWLKICQYCCQRQGFGKGKSKKLAVCKIPTSALKGPTPINKEEHDKSHDNESNLEGACFIMQRPGPYPRLPGNSSPQETRTVTPAT